MNLSTSLTIISSMLAMANAVMYNHECSNGKWTFKCGDTLFRCNVKTRDTCEEGVKHYQKATHPECVGLMQSVTKGTYKGYLCPLDASDGKRHILSHWTNYCVKKTCEAKNDVCVPMCSELSPTSGGGGGDPHFRTYDGTSYSYHGECDLVMARSYEFGPGKVSLDLHIRTKSMGTWSLISNAALRIGREVLEFENDGFVYINGKEVSFPYALDGRYTVTKDMFTFEQKHEDGEVEMVERQIVLVDLGKGEYIRMTMVKGMIYVRVNAYIPDTEGMLGVHGNKGMVSRDGSVLQDENVMGEMWQVRDTEDLLFREARFPQHPTRCIPPAVDGRRLRASAMERERAKNACASADDSTRHFCIEDVLLSGDVKVAAGYMFGEAF